MRRARRPRGTWVRPGAGGHPWPAGWSSSTCWSGLFFRCAMAVFYFVLTKHFFGARLGARRPLSRYFFIPLLLPAPRRPPAGPRTPPYFSLALHGGPGEYHGFLW